MDIRDQDKTGHNGNGHGTRDGATKVETPQETPEKSHGVIGFFQRAIDRIKHPRARDRMPRDERDHPRRVHIAGSPSAGMRDRYIPSQSDHSAEPWDEQPRPVSDHDRWNVPRSGDFTPPPYGSRAGSQNSSRDAGRPWDPAGRWRPDARESDAQWRHDNARIGEPSPRDGDRGWATHENDPRARGLGEQRYFAGENSDFHARVGRDARSAAPGYYGAPRDDQRWNGRGSHERPRPRDDAPPIMSERPPSDWRGRRR